jgi:hypothetical protein
MVSKLLELFVHDWSALTSNPWVDAAPIVVAPELAFITIPLAPIFNLLVAVDVVIVKTGVTVVPLPMMMPAIEPADVAVGEKL